MSEKDNTQFINIDMQVIADYITDKYMFKTSIDENDTLYVTFETGRLVILYEEFLYFIDNNQEQYADWGWTDLIDIYLVYCLTSTLNKYTDSIYHNSNLILQ